MFKFAPPKTTRVYTLASLALLATGTIAPASVMAMPIIDAEGNVRVESNAFDLSTGELQNETGIQLPDGLLDQPVENVSQPTRPGLAPSSVNLEINEDYIDEQLRNQLPSDVSTDYTLDAQSITLNTQFNLRYSPGNHGFGEGIQVVVYDAEGNEINRQVAYVRGDNVTLDPAGQLLPDQAEINVTYSAGDRVMLRVMHQAANEIPPRESGIYFTNNGEFAVEDRSDGEFVAAGRRPRRGSFARNDFNDGDYFRLSDGEGNAVLTDVDTRQFEETTFIEEIITTPLDPLVRQEEEVIETLVSVDRVATHTEEQREYGEVELNGLSAAALSHSLGATTADNEQLVYNRYAGAAQVRLGNDGGSLIGQLPPLINNPAVPPTLVTGTLRFDPGAAVNQAGLSGTISLTQFFHPTHREAVDMFGQVITNPDPNGPRLVQPAGLLSNTRLVGYVPHTPDQVVTGRALTSVNGIFELPVDEAVVIAPPNPEQVGPGNAAYTHNVGGLVIERVDGSIEFVPQWTRLGHATEPIALAAGEASRVIYALVPQQAAQDLQLGQTYPLTVDANAGYHTVDGNWQVIAADIHRDNFLQEAPEIYAVEDTLEQQNAVTEEFNGLRGLYRQTPNGSLVPTLSLTDPDGVDARLGNSLATADTSIPGQPGQPGFYTTTVAAGLYARGSLSLGLGNQQDVITTTTTTESTQTDGLSRQTITRFFETPVTQVDTIFQEWVQSGTETTTRSGNALFTIDSEGALGNVQFNRAPDQVTTVLGNRLLRNETKTTEAIQGIETLVGEANEIEFIPGLESDGVVEVDRQATTRTETYPNVSPLLGELAVGGVLNFGNTPWTPAANTLRAELFTQGLAVGIGNGGSTGWRVETVINPFGEQQRPAYGIDPAGNVTALYQTEPLLDEFGAPIIALIADASGGSLPIVTHQFITDESGDRIPLATWAPVEPLAPVSTSA
jgi:hypothetical protein